MYPGENNLHEHLSNQKDCSAKKGLGYYPSSKKKKGSDNTQVHGIVVACSILEVEVQNVYIPQELMVGILLSQILSSTDKIFCTQNVCFT